MHLKWVKHLCSSEDKKVFSDFILTLWGQFVPCICILFHHLYINLYVSYHPIIQIIYEYWCFVIGKKMDWSMCTLRHSEFLKSWNINVFVLSLNEIVWMLKMTVFMMCSNNICKNFVNKLQRSIPYNMEIHNIYCLVINQKFLSCLFTVKFKPGPKKEFDVIV